MSRGAGEAPGAVLVVGSGLIGSSIGLALRRSGTRVLLQDRDEGRVRLAADLGAGEPADGTEPAVAVAAVPPLSVPQVCAELLRLYPHATVIDVAAVKTSVLAEIETLTTDTSRTVGTHPMAGRERGGPSGARPDLFEGRVWVLTPDESTSASALADAEWLVRSCGGVPVRMSAAEHDRTVALLSHAPQLVASALAAELTSLPPDRLDVAGTGLRDVLRIAESDPSLWTEIAIGNAGPLGTVLRRLAARLGAVADELLAGGPPPDALPALRATLAEGNAGYRALPGKHGGRAEPLIPVPVLLGDRPGELARLFADIADLGVNVEDVELQHAPGHPVGVAEVVVKPAAADGLRTALVARGWTVY